VAVATRDGKRAGQGQGGKLETVIKARKLALID